MAILSQVWEGLFQECLPDWDPATECLPGALQKADCADGQ